MSLPYFRNTFFNNSGVRDCGNGHNASHTHSHNRGSSINLTHNHYLYGPAPYGISGHYNYGYFARGDATSQRLCFFSDPGYAYSSGITNSTSLSIPALNLQTQGSGSTPEPNYYGTRILLKY